MSQSGWLQVAAFHPFFRSHTSLFDPDQEPWSYGEPYTSIARGVIRLRYALLPYIYTLAWEASQRGWPLVRPLFWVTEKDCASGGGRASVRGRPEAGASGEDDAFLLGDSLLVAPVTQPEAASREVPVPPGLWYDFWTDERVHGPSTVSLAAPLERVPLLVRAGTVLPMEEPAESTATRRLDRLYLHLYPPDRSGEFTLRLYCDAWDGYGPHRLDDFVLRSESDGGALYREVVPVVNPSPGRSSSFLGEARDRDARPCIRDPGKHLISWGVPEP